MRADCDRESLLSACQLVSAAVSSRDVKPILRNFKVIAEEVEDAAALEAARRMGVDYVQGYAIGKPVPLSLAA